MQSPSEHATVPPGCGRQKSDLSVLIEDLHQFAFEDEHSVPRSFSNAVRDFEHSSCEIQKIHSNKEIVVEKLFEQYSDSDEASEILVENAKLFEELQQLLHSETKPLTSDEDREAFVNEKLWLEEAIEKYRNEISLLETQRATEMENMKTKHDSDHSRLKERKRSLEAEIHDFMQDLEQQEIELRIKHEQTLVQLLAKFRARLMEIEGLRSHQKCESELASWRSSWFKTLQGSLEVAMERTQRDFPEVRPKKRCTASRDPPRTGIEGLPVLRDCAVAIESIDEVPDSSDDVTPKKATPDALDASKVRSDNCVPAKVTSDESTLTRATDDGFKPGTTTNKGPKDGAVGAETPSQPPPATPAGQGTSRRRLFAETPIEGPCGIITDSSPRTIDEYLQSLKRLVSENTKLQKRLKRKKTL